MIGVQDRDELIADLYRKGQSTRQIAVAVNMDHSGVRLVLKRMGVEMRGHASVGRGKKTTPETEAEIVRLYARGHSIKSVGGMVSPTVSNDTVRRVLNAAGIPTGRRGPKPSVRETAPPKTPVIVQGDAFRAREDRFVTLRRKGLSSHQAATEMDLTEGQRDFLERMFRAQSHMANKPDTSSPKFAHDAKHVAALIKAGGFAHLSERWEGRTPVVCLPLVPFKPEARA